MSQAKNDQIVVKCVEVSVLPDKLSEFIAATRKNTVNTRQEPGNLRFELHQSAADPTIFFLFEVFRDPQAVDFHKATAHYQEWCKVAEPLMKAPRRSSTCKVVLSDSF